ncbi:MAG: hypothetical protein IPM54_32950 [Polyangiaceae bacterium]|nr:hypothetical protein [Polyangiaceae bacterium]
MLDQPSTSAAATDAPAPKPKSAPAADAGKKRVRCHTCLEVVTPEGELCPGCAEPLIATRSFFFRPGVSGGKPPTWLALHWRPLVIALVMAVVFGTGIALRNLAPTPFSIPKAASRASLPAGPSKACSSPCWNGEACQLGQCIWQKPNDVAHLGAQPIVAGPFNLPKDVSDALPLDADRFALALLTGMQVLDARTGAAITLVSDAPQLRALYRVGEHVYGTSPQRIYVIDPASTGLLKTIDLGALVGQVSVGANGRRALVSLPSVHAVAILATEYHAEIDRIHFGDDAVGPMGVDDTGTRALTATGQIPLLGLRDPAGGVVYAFDPSRLASQQDRVRTSMLGNPVSVLMTPDGSWSYVALRAENAIVPLEWLPSGAVRRSERIETCREPEQIELLRHGRRALVRCHEGRAVEVFDLRKNTLIRRVAFNGRATDLVVSPDGEQALVTLTNDGSGGLALMDLRSYAVTVLPLSAEPTRVRLTPDGRMALVLSDRAKVAWVVR